MIIFWIIVFIISLAVLVKGADWLITSAEKMGLSPIKPPQAAKKAAARPQVMHI